MLSMNKVTKQFKRKTVLNQLTMSIEPGIYGLLGPNGAGKTTLMRCLTNLYSYDGEILYKGKEIKNNQEYMQTVGYLPQKFGAYREMSIVENLRYFCQLKNIDKGNWSREIDQVLTAVNLFDDKGKKVKALSGGMLRRMGIAQVLLGEPEVMIFDEPTAGLDPEERLRFKMIVSALAKDKIILISTHIVEDVEALCNNIIIVNAGQVLFKGDAKELKAIAEGKTFECEKEELKRIEGKYFVERQFEDDDQIKFRFVATNCQKFTGVKPRIEDGYICVLEKI